MGPFLDLLVSLLTLKTSLPCAISTWSIYTCMQMTQNSMTAKHLLTLSVSETVWPDAVWQAVCRMSKIVCFAKTATECQQDKGHLPISSNCNASMSHFKLDSLTLNQAMSCTILAYFWTENWQRNNMSPRLLPHASITSIFCIRFIIGSAGKSHRSWSWHTVARLDCCNSVLAGLPKSTPVSYTHLTLPTILRV